MSSSFDYSQNYTRKAKKTVIFSLRCPNYHVISKFFRIKHHIYTYSSKKILRASKSRYFVLFIKTLVYSVILGKYNNSSYLVIIPQVFRTATLFAPLLLERVLSKLLSSAIYLWKFLKQ